MYLTASVFVLTVISCCQTVANGRHFFRGDENYNKITDILPNTRIKRGSILAGRTALKYILSGAKPIYSFGRISVFTKPGGYRQAIRDFKAVHPENIEVVHDIHGIVRNTGVVGDKRIVVEKGKGTKSSSLRITKNCCEFPSKKTDPIGENIIIYKND